MKVLLITGFIPSRSGGGVERHVYDLALGLVRRGVDVTVVCEDVENFHGDYTHLAGRLRRIPVRHRHWFSPLKRIRQMSAIADAGNFSLHLLERSVAASKAVSLKDFDIVHGHAQAGAAALVKNRLARGARPASIATMHGTSAGFYRSLRRDGLGLIIPTPEIAASALMEMAAVHSADACIAVSGHVKGDIIRYYRANASRVNTIYNWADREFFRPLGREESRKALGLEPDRRYLLYVGRTDVAKGYQVLVEAMRQVGDEAILLVASGTTGSQVEKDVGNIRCLGHVDELLPLYYSACDLFVFPSISEGLPLTLIEAMSCGAVPVCMRRPPMTEVIDESTGYFCDRFDATAFSAAVLHALRDEDRDKKSLNCIAGSRRFDMDASIDATMQVYESLMKKQP